MIRSLLGGVAVLGLLAGAAHAQDTTTYYSTRTTTATWPFGQTYRTTTTTTSTSPAPINQDSEALPPPPPTAEIPPPPPPIAEIPPPPPDDQSADIGDEPPPPPPPGSAPDYSRQTTTRHIDPFGDETDRTDTLERNQTYYDESGSHATTQTRSTVTNYAPGPPVALVPNQTTRTTTTTTDDE